MTSSKYLGVDIGGTKVHLGVVQHGELVQDIKFETSANAPKEQILAELTQQLAPLVTADVVGIGIGVPGLVDEENGIVHNVQNIPSWREVHLKQHLASRFDKPVYLTNDANAFAIGEKMYGQGQPYANLVGLALGTGLGGGIIINHQLYSGALSSAGEFGSVPYLDKTLEDYCSGKFFVQRTGQTGAVWHTRAEQGDAEALAIYTEFGWHLGQALHIILYALAPQAIFLGGSVSSGFSFFRRGLYESLAAFPFKQVTERLIIAPSALRNAAVLGAAALCHLKQNSTSYPQHALPL
jgi:glucokinase